MCFLGFESCPLLSLSLSLSFSLGERAVLLTIKKWLKLLLTDSLCLRVGKHKETSHGLRHLIQLALCSYEVKCWSACADIQSIPGGRGA
jgi:hypothetical protein